jgi:hypothetical protein
LIHFTVTFDAADHEALADWWAETLGWERRGGDEETAVVVPAGADADRARREHLLFMKVAEAKAAKNRVHLDLHPEGDTAAFLNGLAARGATVLDRHTAGAVSWAVVADPEGNEFCVVLGRSQT